MRQLLLRAFLLLLLLTGLRPGPAVASHLLGGEMTYQYLDANGPAGTQFRYRITVFIYLNSECAVPGSPSQTVSNVPDGRCNIFLNLYNKGTGQRIVSNQGTNSFPCTQITCGSANQPDQQPAGTFRLPRISNPSITPPLPGGCSIPIGSVPPVRLARYEAIVNLPVSIDGYYAVYTDGTRNFNIDNLSNPSNQNQTLYVEMAGPLLPNSSPTFADTAVVVICQGDTSILVNNAVDPDGDRLIYSFSTPFNGNQGTLPTFALPPSVTYGNGYSFTNPFGTGPGNYAFLNASNGISRYATSRVGRFVVAVEVKEYRTINGNEVLIGSTRREIQLVSRTCQPNRSPQFTPASVATRTFTIQEGQPLTFNLAATDPDGNPINLRANSVLLDGNGPFNATFGGSQGTVLPGAPTGSVTVQGTGGSVNSQFVFNSQCGNARSTPYDVVITATDVACGAKTVAEVFQILVTKAAGPTSISGDLTICDRAVVRPYAAAGPTPASYLWTVRGGTIQGSNTGSAVQVLWNGTGAGRVTVRGVSALGCPTDSVSRTIDVRPASSLAVTPASPVICQGVATTLTATGGTTYTWTSSTGQTYTGASITVSPTATTTYTVTTSDGVCTTTRTATVTVNTQAVANAGVDATLCSGVATTLGSAGLTGYTYQWSPATGLSSATAAQPTLLLTNTGTTPQNFTYVVTATTAQGCIARDTVSVLINPAAVAQAGPDRAFCSGGTATLGNTASVVAGSTYAWSPTVGLSSPNTATSAVTLTNTTAAPLTNTYILTVTTGNGCVARDTVRVTVNPAAIANAGTARVLCSGTSATLGSAALTGYTYQWSPAAGLSSATAAQPTLLLTNTGTTPQNFTYTVTATTAQGCTATSTIAVTVNPAAVANAGTNRALCSGEQSTLGSAALTGYTYQWSPATGLSSATTAQPVFSAINNTSAPQLLSYTVTATTAEGCTATSTVVVTVNPAAVAQAGANQTFCSGGTASLGSAASVVAGSTYSWSPTTGLSNSAVATPSVTLTNVSNTSTAPLITDYVLTVTTSNGCVARDTVRVTVNPAVVAFAGTDAVVCSGVSAPIGTTALYPTGTTFAWSPGTGVTGPAASFTRVTLTNTTSTPIVANYVLTATTALGCVSRDTVRVTVNPAAVANAGASRAVCSAEATTLGSAALTGYTYSWSPAVGLSSPTVAQPVFLQTNSGTTPQVVTYTLTATTAQGCTATSTVAVTVNPAAVANAGPDATLCDGRRTTLGSAALTGYTYQWSPATNLSSATSARPTFTAVNTTQTPFILTYVLTATTAQNCVGRDTIRIAVNPRPLPDSIQGTASVCPTVQGIGYSIRAPRGTAYQWIVTGGTLASGQGTAAITVNWGAASTTASVKAFRLNSFGCSSDTITFPVRINQQLVTQRPTGPLSVCLADGPYTYQTQLTNGSTYGWQIIGGTQVGTNQNTVQVNFTRVGIAKLVVTESSNPAGGRCLGQSDTLYVTVRPSPAANLAISGPARACAAPQSSVSFSLPGAVGSTYAWTVNGVPQASPAGTLPVGASVPGTYTITVRETNNSLCAGPLYTKTFTVVPTLAIAGPASYCPESRTSLSYTIGAGQTGGVYQWTVAGGTIVSGQNSPTIRVDFPAGTATATIQVNETTSSGCTASFTVRPDNASVALAVASVGPQNDRQVVLALNVPNNTGNTNRVNILRRPAGSTAAFTNVGNVANTATSFTDTGVDADATAYDYRLDLTNACGTVLSSTQHTTIRTQATAVEGGAGRDQGKVTLTWNPYVGFTVREYQVFRTPDNGPETLLQTVVAGTTSLTVATGSAGFNQCFRVQAVSTTGTPVSSSNVACVEFANDLVFYNVVTPNGDGLNDQFIVKNAELYNGTTLTVFNRWGKEVYKTTNYRNTYDGANSPAGVYYYQFQLAGGQSYKGWFEVVK